ncbi:hypothetical protein QYF36_018743 [Acer negundo]|nr:hypothetical protein QYF36_018743 [Acer negundo]
MDQNYFPPLTSLQLSCIFIFFLLTRSSTTASGATVDSHYLDCVNKTCGDGQNISFPFYIKDQQKSFCGFPGFELSCNKAGNPIMRLPDSGNQYIIHHIFYNNQTLRVSNSVFWDTKSSTSGSGGNHCDVVSSFKNLSFPTDHQFELVGDPKTQVSVLYNCSSGGDNRTLSERLVSKKVDGCWNGDHDSVVAMDEDDPDLGLAKEECTELMVAPVEGYGGKSTAMITRLRGGFVMKWTASNCSVCEQSGGKCGFDNSTFHFKCFCPDRPHAWKCTVRPGHGKKTLLGLTLGFGIGVSVLLIVAMSIYIIWCHRKEIYASPNSRYTSSDPYSNSDLEAASAYFGVPIFSYGELAEATNNFNHEKELGDGGFGTVYYGKLRDGREVAVKRLGQCLSDSNGKFQCSGSKTGNRNKTRLGLKLGFGIGGPVLLIVALSIYITQRRRKGIYDSPNSRYTSSDPSSKSDLEAASAYFGVPIFSYSELAEATNNFNHEKELGDGGFGTVYYGKLRDGREVAVKRLPLAF